MYLLKSWEKYIHSDLNYSFSPFSSYSENKYLKIYKIKIWSCLMWNATWVNQMFVFSCGEIIVSFMKSSFQLNFISSMRYAFENAIKLSKDANRYDKFLWMLSNLWYMYMFISFSKYFIWNKIVNFRYKVKNIEKDEMIAHNQIMNISSQLNQCRKN